MFKEVNCCFKVIILRTHEQYILFLPTLNLHIGPILLQEHQHVDITMQSCEMKSSEAIRILMIDPCP
jgi:hypothetical protein